ncbi:hypothetical protein NPIL_33691 [Nephila pilipes]|uniref:Uncharacterized protein n=1 Tax=Nephila pilipes TaxID=299642 RepID=A0A8X6NDS4_NEPPI|nr:hypothetical protein NPIL_33691 [Nephila pilipes]
MAASAKKSAGVNPFASVHRTSKERTARFPRERNRCAKNWKNCAGTWGLIVWSKIPKHSAGVLGEKLLDYRLEYVKYYESSTTTSTKFTKFINILLQAAREAYEESMAEAVCLA